MKKSTLKASLESELPPKISVQKGKDLQQLDEEKLEQIYPKAKPPVVIIPISFILYTISISTTAWKSIVLPDWI